MQALACVQCVYCVLRVLGTVYIAVQEYKGEHPNSMQLTHTGCGLLLRFLTTVSRSTWIDNSH